MNLPKK